MKKLEQEVSSKTVSGDWCHEPIVIKNQQLFRVDPWFCEKLSCITTRLRFIINIRKNFLISKQQLYGRLESQDNSTNLNANAYSFNLEGLVDMEMPKCLTLTKLDGIISYGMWFTAGHIETGGDDSITFVPVGKKLMLIAKRGRASRRLESLFTSKKALVDCLSKPPSKLMRRSVKFFFTDCTSLMIQPALWAHTVITLSEGPALVVGFEGNNEKDLIRRDQVLSYYSTGLDQNKRKIWLNTASDGLVLKKIKKCRRNTAVQEHLECLQYDGQCKSCSRAFTKVRVPKRRLKLFAIQRFRQKWLLKNKEKAGN